MLTDKEKEFIGIGASVAAGCRPCTEHHVKAARAAAMCDRSIALAVEVSLAVRQSATAAMDEWAEQCQGVRPQPDAAFHEEKRLVAELTAVAAAFAVNSVPDLKARLAAACAAGATPEQIRMAIAIAGMVRKAAEEKIAALLAEVSAISGSGCDAPLQTAGCSCGSSGD